MCYFLTGRTGLLEKKRNNTASSIKALILTFSILCVFKSMDVNAMSLNADSIEAFETGLMEHINNYRKDLNLIPLLFDEGLNRLAAAHSKQMFNKKGLSHDNFDERFNISGSSICVENTGVKAFSSYEQFAVWKNSRAHNKNLTNKNIKRAGISRIGDYVTFFACD